MQHVGRKTNPFRVIGILFYVFVKLALMKVAYLSQNVYQTGTRF
jgi:hypothetical protein